MKYLVIGKGGREHAIIWKLLADGGVDKIYWAPGNEAAYALFPDDRVQWANIPESDIQGLVDFAKEKKVDLVIPGPEAPLVAGLADRMAIDHIPCLGPTRQAAQIEGSKILCKKLLQKYDIPTAPFDVFRFPGKAMRYVESLSPTRFPIVIKADGLAAGKGVFVAKNEETALDAINRLMVNHQFGPAGDTIIIEDFLSGRECSYIVLTDSKNSHIEPFPVARDHKRLLDHNQGPNTGGMGAYAPVPDISPDREEQIVSTIVWPTLKAMATEGLYYQGFLYFGLMITDSGPMVLEINCRLGDPETQVQLPLLKSSLSDLLWASLNKQGPHRPEWHTNRATACVVLAAPGYPDKLETGFFISGLDVPNDERCVVFHAGTGLDDPHRVKTNGGRVINVVGLGRDLAEARSNAYRRINGKKPISFPQMQFRTDIAEI